MHGHDEVGPRKQPAPAPKALVGTFEPEIPFAQHGPDHTGQNTDQRQRPDRDDGPDKLGEETQSRQPLPRSGQLFAPGAPVPDFERQDEIELLREAGGHRHDRERKLEQTEGDHTPGRHGEEQSGALIGRKCGRAIDGCGTNSFAAAPRQLAQPLALALGHIGQLEVVTAARTGFELDLDQPEQSRQELLLEAHVLDPLIGHRARGTREHAAIDADIRGSDSIGQAAPAQIGEQQVESDRNNHQWEEVDDDIVEIAPVENREPADDDREDQLPDQRGRTHCECARVGPERGCDGFLAHRVSRLMAVRISSRMAVASACFSPGSDTEALCVPAVCTVSVARPKARSSGP